MEENNKTQLDQEKREARRKRRVRNQIIAYLVMLVLIAAVAGGVVYSVKKITDASRQQSEEKQEQIDQIIASEESIDAPVEESSEEVTPEPTAEEKLDEIVNAGIEVMPLEDKVAGLFLVTPESITGVSTATQAGDGTKEALTEYAVGGIIYSQKNMLDADQLQEMIDNTNLYAHYPLFIAVEEEGGSVSPVSAAGLADATDSAQTIGSTGSADGAYTLGTTIGTYLAELGFNLNLGVVADLAVAEDSVMEERSFGSDTEIAAACVTNMVLGLEEQNVDSCLKYFPGIGSATSDPQESLVSTDRTAEEFRANEFTVFQAGIDAGADMVMVSHISAPALTGDSTPCSMSSAVVTDILRTELGFDGVIISDAMNVSAITEYYSADQAAVLAIKAGCDMILMPEDYELAYNGVLEAVESGVISEERINDSLRRIYRIKYADKVTE